MHLKFVGILRSNIEYELLPFQFVVLTVWNIWCPKDWPRRLKNTSIILFIVILILNFIMCTEMLIYFILSIGTEQFKLTNLFFVSASITGVYKSLKIMKNRKIIRCFVRNYFNHQWIKLLDDEENEIHEKINTRIRHITVTYFISMISIILMKDLGPIAESGLAIQLPADGWYPYDIENSVLFGITYVHQVILGSFVICAHVGIDTLFVGLLLKLLGQINILKHRLQILGNSLDHKMISLNKFESFQTVQKHLILECIHHHKRIYRFGEDLNKIFQEMLLILVVSSLPNICINIYALSSNLKNINMDYIATFFSTTSAFIQFFIACWFGNEVSLNSVEVRNAVYAMDWNKLDTPTQKLLIVVMARSLKPIEFSVGYIIPMNVDSFLKIIKASYTAFNLLQQTSSS